jgi:hypothetical protein
MNSKDSIKSYRFEEEDGTYLMDQTGKVKKVIIDSDGDEQQIDVGPLEQITLRKKFKSRIL